MNRALPLPDMLHCLNGPENLAGTDMSVLERQLQRYFDENELSTVFSVPAQAQQFQGFVSNEMCLNELVTRATKPGPDLANVWSTFGQLGGESFEIGSGFEFNCGISRTSSYPPALAKTTVTETEQRESVSQEKMSSTVGRQSFKKRKADKNQSFKAIAEDESKEKRIRGCPEEEESKITQRNSNNNNSDNKKSNNSNNKTEISADSSKEKSKISEVQKPDYIHVRARRGQATDSHSLAERVRREKISERMKYLQDLVPGCNKITGKAGMLDEIINYVQSLQRQVEFLSMKLAAVNPTLDFNIDNLFSKELFPACTSNFPVGVSSEITNPAYLQFNQIQKLVSCNGLEMGINPFDLALRRVISAPVSMIPEASSSFNHIQPLSAWDSSLQSLYGEEFLQGRSTSFPFQQFTGSNEASNLKMEM